MAITFTCMCGKAVQVGDEFAGRQGQCPSCGRTVQIPGDGQFTEQAPPIVPRPAGSAKAPWDDVPRVERLPKNDDDDIARLVTHAGLPVEPNDDFFVEAPKEIGGLRSAFTTLKTDVEPKTLVQRLLPAAIALPIAMLVPCIFVIMVPRNMQGQVRGDTMALILVLIGLVVVVVSVAVSLWWTRFRHACSYVGVKGIAVFECAGRRDKLVRSEILLFEDATELRMAQTRRYYNGVYTGTDYNFAWSDERGHVAYRFAGRYSSKTGMPPPGDAFHFALAAEDAWTLHLSRDIDRIIKAGELLFFSLKGGAYVELGPDLFILVQGGKRIELPGAQIEKMTIGDGVISVWETGAKTGWFVNKGIHQFLYADLGNARFFVFALEKLLGIRF